MPQRRTTRCTARDIRTKSSMTLSPHRNYIGAAGCSRSAAAPASCHVPLAQHGAELVAVEIGRNLGALARRNLADFPTTRVEIGGFEEWPLPPDPFDAVVSASALHWIDPSVRFSKPARALKPGGVLVVVHVHHVKGGTPGFFGDTQPFYLRWGLSDDPSFEPPAPKDAPIMYAELEDQPEFGAVQRHRFEIPRRHTTDSYVGWLKTDSLVSSLDPESRQGFLNDIETLIDTSTTAVWPATSSTRSSPHCATPEPKRRRSVDGRDGDPAILLNLGAANDYARAQRLRGSVSDSRRRLVAQAEPRRIRTERSGHNAELPQPQTPARRPLRMRPPPSLLAVAST